MRPKQRIKAITAKDLKTIKPAQIIGLSRDGANEAKRQEIFNWYKRNNSLSVAVLNAVLILILRIKKGFLPGVKYLDSTIKTFIENGVTTPTQASHRLEEYHNIKVPNINEKVSANEPDWLDGYMKELFKEIAKDEQI